MPSFQGGHIKIHLKTDMPVQVDGEPWIQSPGEVVVLKSALKVCGSQALNEFVYKLGLHVSTIQLLLHDSFPLSFLLYIHTSNIIWTRWVQNMCTKTLCYCAFFQFFFLFMVSLQFLRTLLTYDCTPKWVSNHRSYLTNHLKKNKNYVKPDKKNNIIV